MLSDIFHSGNIFIVNAGDFFILASKYKGGLYNKFPVNVEVNQTLVLLYILFQR